jgi:phage tail-like protein
VGKPFTVNLLRFSPYPSSFFLIYLGPSTTPCAMISKVGKVGRSTEVIEYKVGGNPLILKSNGRTRYDPIILERGITQDLDFVNWANAAQVLDKGSPSTSLANLRKEVRIDLLNEAAQPVWRYFVHRAWVSEYQAMPDLDAGANAVAIEHIKLENEGWERDTTLVEPLEP